MWDISWSVVEVGRRRPLRLLFGYQISYWGGEKRFGRRYTAAETGRGSDKGRVEAVTYPAVNLPTILVPAIVAWHMGITSCNSASKTL